MINFARPLGKSGILRSIPRPSFDYNEAMPRLLLIILALVPALAADAVAAAAGAGPGALERDGSAVVADILDGDTLVLEDGREVRLVGIQAPKLPLGRPNFPEWPLGREAKATLVELALGRRLTLSYGGRRADRHGRLLAHLHDQSGRWIQGEILARGMARVYSFSDNRALIREMLAIERTARAARRGIWAHPFYRVISHRETWRFLNTFQLVKGRVMRAAVVRGRGYLNFDDDWRTDFTISIAPKSVRLFRAAGIELHAYEGRSVRVRGWLKSFNGPMIEVTHPEQIEVLGE